MLRRYPWKAYASAAAVLAVAYFTIAFLLRADIAEGFNTVSLLPWIFAIFASGPAAAGAAILTLRHHRADKNAITRTSPRSRITIGCADWLMRYLALAVIPFALCYTCALIYSTISTNRGLLDLGHIVPALLFQAFIILMGELIARMLAGKELVAILLVFVIGVFLGQYSTYGGSGQNNWEQANPELYSFVLALLALALLARLLVDLPHHRHWAQRILLGITSAAFIAMFYVTSPVYTTIARMASPDSYICEEAEPDVVCVWKESDYRIPFYAAQIERGRLLADKFGVTITPTLFYEEGLELAGSDPRLATWQIDPYSSLSANGAQENSWMSAQSVTSFYLRKIGFYKNDCDIGSELPWLLLDLTTNYTYGDITFSHYSSQDPHTDAIVKQLGESWATLSDEQIADNLQQMLSEYMSTCTVKELS